MVKLQGGTDLSQFGLADSTNLGDFGFSGLASVIITCIASFQTIPPFLSGALSNMNKTVSTSGGAGDYNNAWGKIVSPGDSNTYALECDITPISFGTGGFPFMGIIDTVTGEYAGFIFTGIAMDIINFDGTNNNTFSPIGAPSQIGINYQASTGNFSFWFKNSLDNPISRSNIAPIISPNPIRFAIGVISKSAGFLFDYTINSVPSEANIVYPNGVVGECGASFINLNFLTRIDLGEAYDLSNNNRTLTSDGGIGLNYVGALNQNSPFYDDANRVMEIEITSITTPGANIVTMGISDTMSTTCGAVQYVPGSGFLFGSNDGSVILDATYVMQVGDIWGITVNRSNGVAQAYLNQAGNPQKWDVTGYIETSSTLYGILFITNNSGADIMSVTHHCNYDEMVGTYEPNCFDFGGRQAPEVPAVGNVWDDGDTWDDTDVWQD